MKVNGALGLVYSTYKGRGTTPHNGHEVKVIPCPGGVVPHPVWHCLSAVVSATPSKDPSVTLSGQQLLSVHDVVNQWIL